MESNLYNADIDYLKKSLNTQRLANLGLVVCVLVGLIHFVQIHGSERTVITPGAINKSMWITDRTMSESGIEMWAAWLSWLKLDVTPESVDYKNEIVLKHTHPGQAGAMKERQLLDAEKIKKENLASTFAIQSIVVNDKKIAAVLQGRLQTFVNGRMVTSTEKFYFVRFTVNGATPQLQIFKEVSHGDIGKNIEENPL
jgi:conjugal transfer pilus assembly protein TraE